MPADFKGQTQAENRRYPRIHLKLWVHFKCLDKGVSALDLESLAEDLGAGGMAMRSDRDLKPGQLLMLTLYLPPASKRESVETLIYSEKESLPVAVLSRVVWSAAAADGEFLVGVQFLDLEAKDRRTLKTFLVDYNLDQPDSKLYT
jgi:c-di-GMP-binding flagellar brake protein YcgR